MDLKYYLRGLGVGIVVTALIMGIATSADSKDSLSDEEIKERARELGMVEESTVLADTFAEGNMNSSIGGARVGELSKEVEEAPLLSPTPDKEEEETPTPQEDISPSPDMEGEKDSATSASPNLTVKEATPTEVPAATATPTPTTAPTSEPTATATPTPTEAPTTEPTAVPIPEATTAPTATPAAASEQATQTQQEESVTIQIASGDSSFTVCKKLAEAGLVESAADFDTYLCQNGYDKRIRAGVFEIPVGAGEEAIAGIILKIK